MTTAASRSAAFVALLQRVRPELTGLAVAGQEAIARVGVTLEEALSEAPAAPEGVGRVLVLALQGLQALYQGTAGDASQTAAAVAAAVEALEADTAFLAAAEEQLTAALRVPTGAASPTVPATVPAAPDASGAAPPDRPTLDDVATLLMQVEPEDAGGIARLRAAVQSLAADEALPAPARALVVRAEAALAGAAETGAEAAIVATGRLLESAAATLDVPAGSPEKDTGAGSTAAPAQSLVARAAHALAGVAETGAQVAAGAVGRLIETAVGSAERAPTPPESPPAESSAESAPATPPGGAAQVITLGPDPDIDLLGEFVTESREYAVRAEAALLALEGDPDDSESINVIFRAFHTVKGTSAFLGLPLLAALAHRAESLFSRARDKEIRCTGGYADLALQSIDALKALIEGVQTALNGGHALVPDSYADLLRVLDDPEGAGISSAPTGSEVSPTVPLEAVSDRPAATQPRPPTETQTAIRTGSQLEIAAEAPPEAPGAPGQAFGPPGTSSADTSMRVRTDRLDRLIEMVGELVIAHSMIAQDGTVSTGGHYALAGKISHSGKIVRELQDLTLSMRMVPLKPTFQKMARLVRDVAQKTGKRVEFVTEGEDTEIDRNLVDRLNDPLVHMVRNAIDHGIESAAERARLGKPATGTTRLSAFNVGGSVVVQLQDDGKGLDRERIVRKAVAKGLISAERAEKGMPDAEVFGLIFAPGFSTADQVTDLSGRGVGMDVVKRSVEALHGRIEVASETGKGSTFTIRLPLTLAITDGMVVKVGEERYILPTSTIALSFRPEADSLSTIGGQGELVMLRGELLPVFRLHRLFGVANAVEEPTKGLLVVVEDGERRVALLVDELLGQQQVVAKSLGDFLGVVGGVSGAAILGDGRVGLILEPTALTALARRTRPAGPLPPSSR